MGDGGQPRAAPPDLVTEPLASLRWPDGCRVTRAWPDSGVRVGRPQAAWPIARGGVPDAARVDSLWHVSGVLPSAQGPRPSWPGPPWPPLSDDDFDDLVALAARCLAADGGLPLVTDPGFLRRRWTTPASARSATPAAAWSLPERFGTGRRSPGWWIPRPWRGARLAPAGLGTRPVPARCTVETEALTPAAEALFASRGLRQVFAEDVMRIDLTGAVPAAGVARTAPSWRVVRTRPRSASPPCTTPRSGTGPAFQGGRPAEWIADVADDEDFRPDWSVLATVPGTRRRRIRHRPRWAGSCRSAWLPAARGHGLGAALVRESLARQRYRGGDGGLAGRQRRQSGCGGAVPPARLRRRADAALRR